MPRIHASSSLIVIGAVTASLASSSPLNSQEAPLETKLIAAAGVEGDEFGTALALDGDVLVVAAPGADVGGGPGSGAVYVFLRDPASGQWVEHQQLVIPAGDPAERLYELPLAIDGDTIVVGAPYTTLREFQQGVVYVFERDEGGLWDEVTRLSDVSVEHGGHFGGSVALEGDLLVVGAPQDASARNGWVRIFERDRGGADNWGRVATLAHTSVGDGVHPQSFGSDVALQGDLLAVGASRTSLGFNTQDGAAYIFRRSATDSDRWDYLVRLVRLGADDCTGGRPLSQFNLEASPEEIEAAAECAQANPIKSGSFGHQLALDGDTLVVSAIRAAGDDGTYSVGKAYVYQRDPGGADAWSYVATLSPSVPSSGGYFGSALALGGDAILIGAPGTTIEDRARQGAAYLFERTAGGPDAWGEVARLVAYDGLSETQFGSAVAFDGAARIIGAKGDSTYRGAVYVQAPAEEPEVPEEPEEPEDPAFPPTGELVDDRVLVSESGVMLGAVEGTALDTLPVWIHEVAVPDEPLPLHATAVSAYYNVGAVETTSLPAEAAFALALPVPASVDPAQLAVAALVPLDLSFGGPRELGHAWLPVLGDYDAEAGVYIVTLGTLADAGTTFVAIEHPGITAPPPPEASARSAASGPAVSFSVLCEPWFLSDQCQHAHEQYAAAELASLYLYYSNNNFKDPNLIQKGFTIYYREPFIPVFVAATPTGTYTGIYIYPNAHVVCRLFSTGHYNVITRTLSLCLSEFGNLNQYVIAHEYFHAVQGSYWGPIQSPTVDWIVEGTATAAAGAPALQRDPDRPLRRIDIGLMDRSWRKANDPYAYEAQDFFVYLGLSKGESLAYLVDILLADPTAHGVNNAIGQRFQSTLQAEYRNWAKNQVIEKEVDFDPDGPAGPKSPWLQSPCRIQREVIALPRSNPPKFKYELRYPAEDSLELDLGYLTTEVVKIEFANPDIAHVNVKVEVKGVAPSPFHKVYLNQTSDIEGMACRNLPEGPRSLTVPALPDQELPWEAYVLVANTRYEGGNPLSYVVSVEEID